MTTNDRIHFASLEAKTPAQRERERAELLAAWDPDYFARRVQGSWVVWSRASDHKVEFE